MDLSSHALQMRGSVASSKGLSMGPAGADPALPVARPGGKTGVRPDVAVRGVPALGAGQCHPRSPLWAQPSVGR